MVEEKEHAEIVISGGYLVRVKENTEDNYKDEMLRNNKIEGLLPIHIQDYNERHEYWYGLDGKETLREYYRKKAPDTEEICSLVNEIENMCQRVERYLLEPEDLVLDYEKIYISEHEYFFMYQPGYGRKVREQIEELMSNLMECVDYENRESVSLLYLLHARVRQEMGSSLKELCDRIVGEERSFAEKSTCELQKIMRETTEYHVEKGEEKKKGKEKDFFAKIQGVFQRLVKKALSEDADTVENIPESEMDDEGETRTRALFREPETETVMLQGEGETVMLRNEERIRLEPLEDNREIIYLSRFPFYLGKEKRTDSYCFHEPVISRKHAEIYKEGDEMFIKDCASLNGTSVNGKKLKSHECCKLHAGDILEFAEIGYILTI